MVVSFYIVNTIRLDFQWYLRFFLNKQKYLPMLLEDLTEGGVMEEDLEDRVGIA